MNTTLLFALVVIAVGCAEPTPRNLDDRRLSMKAMVPLLVSFALVAAPASAQQREYSSSFPGGYPSMSSGGGAGKMYMESYFPRP